MSDQRTEQPTERRRQKAREQGQFPSAKEFVGALQFFVIVLIVTRSAAGWMGNVKVGFHRALATAFRQDWPAEDLIEFVRSLISAAFLPLAISAALVAALTLGIQLATTNMGVSLGRLTPDIGRLSPLARLKDIPKQNIPAAFQALLLLVVLSFVTWGIADEQLPVLMRLPLLPVAAGLEVIAGSARSVLWKGTFLLLLFGTVEMVRQRLLHTQGLRMSRQEIREEMKESDGDPHVKARIRRLRRDLLRRRMMAEVPTATAVIVNPTHFAIAIRYDAGTMASPKVVAKGRNYLAARIRQLATENNVTIVENPPLARALYAAVDVGREIPPDFFRAVAEVLAYVYRVSGLGKAPGANA